MLITTSLGVVAALLSINGVDAAAPSSQRRDVAVTTRRGRGVLDLSQSISGSCGGRKFAVTFPIGRALESSSARVTVKFHRSQTEYDRSSLFGRYLLDAPGPFHARVACEPDRTLRFQLVRTHPGTPTRFDYIDARFDQKARLSAPLTEPEPYPAEEVAYDFNPVDPDLQR